MTTTLNGPAVTYRSPARQILSWHPPLMVLAAAMALLALISAAAIVADPRLITGVPAWTKPFKFAISILIYAVTWAWFISQLTRLRRTAWLAGTVSALFLAVEMVIITVQVIRGTTSHYNLSTPLNSLLWSAMGTSIVVVWVASLVTSVILIRNAGSDRARTCATAGGAVLSLLGMALGFLMTIPSAAQIQAGLSTAGAHTVGLPDGGPGLPLVGWSTVGGDLRIGHFVGLHALQALPIALILLELLSRRAVRLRLPDVRFRLMLVVSALYLAVIAILTWQALRGQSVVHPDRLTVGVTLLAFGAAAAAGTAAWRSGADSTSARRRERDARTRQQAG